MSQPEYYKSIPIVDKINQSPPIDTNIPYDAAWVKDRVIIITGGASGFGAGYAKLWAQNGATIIIGDINMKMADELVQSIRKETGNVNVFAAFCNVTDWQSQVDFFKEARKLSPHGGIDCVVANAGIAGADQFELPEFKDPEAPPKPNLKTIEVNLIGVLYTAHLAMYWLQQNPGSKPCSPKTIPAETTRDRHLCLVGSMASIAPIPLQALYATSKHGVLGLFRTLRSTSWIHGVRVSLVCPYFIDTPILPAPARALLAGGGLGKPEDVVDAATRLVADNRIVGRSMYIGPKMKVIKKESDGEYQLAMTSSSKAQAAFELYAEDYEDSDLFARNLVKLLNDLTRFRGMAGYIYDVYKAIKFGVLAGPRRLLGTAGNK